MELRSPPDGSNASSPCDLLVETVKTGGSGGHNYWKVMYMYVSEPCHPQSYVTLIPIPYLRKQHRR